MDDMDVLLAFQYKKELESMAANPALTLIEIKNSNFYRKMQTAKYLMAHYLRNAEGWSIPAVILVSKIAALSPKLVEADFSGNSLNKDSIEVVENLSKSTSLRTLNLNANGIAGAGIACAERLSGSLISKLKLSNNRLEGQGSEVAAYLSEMKNLKELDLSDNDFGYNGTLVVAQLTQSETLVDLDLTFNDFNEFTVDVAEMACAIPTLRIIKLLSNCRNTDELPVEVVINEHNEKTKETLALREAIECLRNVSSDLGSQYGTVGNLMEAIGVETLGGDEVVTNEIWLLLS